MRNKIELNSFEEHPFKEIITDIGLRQFDLCYSLGMCQSRLSQMLRGIRPMPPQIETKIQEILDGIQKPKPAKKRKIKPITVFLQIGA